MKKRILFFCVLFALMACIFAVSASAEHEYTPLTDEALTNLDVKIILTDGTNEFDTTVKFKDLFNYTLTPANGTTPYSLKLSGIKATTVTVDEAEYTLKTSMVGIYFPDGVTHLEKGFMGQYSTVFSKAHLPDSIEFIGDKVFYKIGAFSFIDENGASTIYLPKNLTAIGNINGTGESHFLSGCTLQGDTIVFPEGFTNFGCDYPLNDGFRTTTGTLKLVFLGKMTNVDLSGADFTSVKMSMHFANNCADDAYITYSDTTVSRRVEARLIDGTWYYAFKSAIDDSDLSYAIDTTGKTLAINYRNSDPNSSGTTKTIDNKVWYPLSSQIPIAYFCSGELMFGARNGDFGWIVYSSEPVEIDNPHPFEDAGVLVEPTCTLGGGVKYSCGACGAFIRLEEQTADALGHEYTEDDLVSSTELTCTQNETKTYFCARCNENFTVVITEATGHDMSEISYPIEATTSSYGVMKTNCASCDYFTESAYGLDPGDTLMTVILDDGTVQQVKASLIFEYIYDASSLVAKISALNETYSIDGVDYQTSQINKIIVPFGFTAAGYNFAGKRDVEILDFSLTKDFALANGAFRDNHYVEQVILGDGAIVGSEAFRGISTFNSLVICDGATVTLQYSIFADDTKGLKEIIVGKGATVNFAKSGLATSGVRASLERIIIGDGATVTFGASSFGALAAITEFSFGENCVVDFGASSFAGANITVLSFPASATVKFSGNGVFKNCTAIESIYLPSSVTSIPNETFNGCTALKTVALMGANSIGDNAFATSNDTVELVIYSHANEMTISSSAFSGRSTYGVVLYTPCVDITSLENCVYTIYNGIPHAQTEGKLDESCFTDGYDGYATECPCGNIVSNVDFTIYSSSAETTTGSYGAHTIIPSLGGHTSKVIIVYECFDKAGKKTVVCSVCDETLEETVATNPIFTHKGYSYKLDGSITGIWSGFNVDKKALNEYEKANETTLTVGMIIANPKYVSDKFFADGVLTAQNGAIQVEIELSDYSDFSCYISGFQVDSNLTSLELVIAGYVYEGNDKTSLQVMQKSYETGASAPVVSKVTKTDATLYTVSIARVQAPVTLPAEIKEYEAPTQA